MNTIEEIQGLGLKFDVNLYNVWIQGKMKLGLMEEVQEIRKTMKRERVKLNLTTYAILVDGYIKTNVINEAMNTLQDMKKGRIEA